MNKLLNLLNQFCEESWKEYRFKEIVDNDFFVIDESKWLWYETIFTKKYLFINRLVETWKVNWWIPNQLIKDIETREMWEYLRLRGVSYYWTDESLLMVLSIQDNPIQFLVSVLK